MNRTRRTFPISAGVLAACMFAPLLLAAAGWFWLSLVTITPFHANGQLMVLGKEYFGDKEGVWVWYRADGSVIVDDDKNGRPRSGYYDDDERVRLLTDEELADASERAAKVMRRNAPRG